MTGAHQARKFLELLHDQIVFLAYDSRHAFMVASLFQFLVASGVRARPPTDIDPVVGDIKTELKKRIKEADVVIVCYFGPAASGLCPWATWEASFAEYEAKKIIVVYESKDQKASLQESPFAQCESLCVNDLVAVWPFPPPLPEYAPAHSKLLSQST